MIKVTSLDIALNSDSNLSLENKGSSSSDSKVLTPEDFKYIINSVRNKTIDAANDSTIINKIKGETGFLRSKYNFFGNSRSENSNVVKLFDEAMPKTVTNYSDNTQAVSFSSGDDTLDGFAKSLMKNTEGKLVGRQYGEPLVDDSKFLISRRGLFNKEELVNILNESWDEYLEITRLGNKNVKKKEQSDSDGGGSLITSLISSLGVSSLVKWLGAKLALSKYMAKFKGLLKTGAKKFLSSVWNIVRHPITFIKNTFKFMKSIFGSIKGFISKIGKGIKFVVDFLKNSGKYAKAAVNFMKNVGKKTVDAAKAGVKFIKGGKATKAAVDGAKAAKNAAQGVTKAAQGAKSAVDAAKAGKAAVEGTKNLSKMGKIAKNAGTIFTVATTGYEAGTILYDAYKRGEDLTEADKILSEATMKQTEEHMETLLSDDASLLDKGLAGAGLVGDVTLGAFALGGRAIGAVLRGAEAVYDQAEKEYKNSELGKKRKEMLDKKRLKESEALANKVNSEAATAKFTVNRERYNLYRHGYHFDKKVTNHNITTETWVLDFEDYAKGYGLDRGKYQKSIEIKYNWLYLNSPVFNRDGDVDLEKYRTPYHKAKENAETNIAGGQVFNNIAELEVDKLKEDLFLKSELEGAGRPEDYAEIKDDLRNRELILQDEKATYQAKVLETEGYTPQPIDINAARKKYAEVVKVDNGNSITEITKLPSRKEAIEKAIQEEKDRQNAKNKASENTVIAQKVNFNEYPGGDQGFVRGATFESSPEY